MAALPPVPPPGGNTGVEPSLDGGISTQPPTGLPKSPALVEGDDEYDEGFDSLDVSSQLPLANPTPVKAPVATTGGPFGDAAAPVSTGITSQEGSHTVSSGSNAPTAVPARPPFAPNPNSVDNSWDASVFVGNDSVVQPQVIQPVRFHKPGIQIRHDDFEDDVEAILGLPPRKQTGYFDGLEDSEDDFDA